MHWLELMYCPPAAGATTLSYVSDSIVWTFAGWRGVKRDWWERAVCAECQEPSSKKWMGCPGNPAMLLSDENVCSVSAVPWHRTQYSPKPAHGYRNGGWSSSNAIPSKNSPQNQPSFAPSASLSMIVQSVT